MINEVGFKQGRAAEKSRERNLKRKADEDAYKQGRTAEKQVERNVKRRIDEDGLRKVWATEKSKQRTKVKEKMKAEIIRRKIFRNSVRDGPIYGCVCCHRIRFKKGVIEYDESLKTEILKYNSDILEKAVGEPKREFLVAKVFFICLDCKTKLLKGKMPALSHKNKLGMVDISGMKELCLTELENCLIARNILFQKFVQLPKSRWTATKDQIVNIPIFDQDILNTVESFPRTPEEAGIIPVRLKRKMEYKNNHIEQFISTTKNI